MIFRTVSVSKSHRVAIWDCESNGSLEVDRAAVLKFAMLCFMTGNWVRSSHSQNNSLKKNTHKEKAPKGAFSLCVFLLQSSQRIF